MGRIRKAYEIRFRTLLQRVGARKLEQGVRFLLGKAERAAWQSRISEADAYTRLYEELAGKPRYRPVPAPEPPSRFLCDAGLGGLARWLRAAGYDAFWQAYIEDDALLREAEKIPGSAILTTDSLLMERRLLRDGVITSYWLPPTLSIAQQLERVTREFRVQAREPRCMSCGGQLRRVGKEALKDRIPPRTYLWLDEYFLCERCGRLFWRGTHWEKIRAELERIGM